MQSESNHIDNFYRRKEAVSVADNSHMDAHWKQMQEMMNIYPVSKAPKTISYKTFLLYAAVILLVAAGIIIVLQNNKADKNIAIKPFSETNKQAASNSTDLFIDNPIQTNENILANVPDKNSKKINQKTESGNNKNTVPINKQEVSPDSKSIATIKDEKKEFDNASVFKKFYTDIKKEPEYFKIDVSRDTTIVCKEGTTVFIPANSFQTANGASVTGPATLAIKEFYEVADIISNNLTTMSNGKQLITGGMLNIAATINGMSLQIKQGSFMDLKMPTRVFNAQMQLFNGQENSMNFNIAALNQEKQTVNANINYETKTISVDTVAKDYVSTTSSAYFNSGINWIPAGQQQFFFDDKMKEITLFDLQDYSHVVWRKNKSIATYLIPYDCPLSTDEMKALLEEKHGKWYDEIKVKRARKPWSKKRRVSYPTDWINDGHFVGDSLVIPLRIAMRRRLITREDSIRYEIEFKKKFDEAVKRSDAYNDFILQKKSYDFRITGLGWINCDRFINYPPGRLTEFYVNTPEGYEGTYFASMLLIGDNRSAMAGTWDLNGTISFAKIPLGENVSLVCLGAKDGKMYASVQQLSVERDPKITLKLEEVTPEEFKEKLSRFGNVQGIN